MSRKTLDSSRNVATGRLSRTTSVGQLSACTSTSADLTSAILDTLPCIFFDLFRNHMLCESFAETRLGDAKSEEPLPFV